jgi:hypothetical protein
VARPTDNSYICTILENDFNEMARSFIATSEEKTAQWLVREGTTRLLGDTNACPVPLTAR